MVKIAAKTLLPLVLDFAQEFLTEEDYKVLSKTLADKELRSTYKESVLVKKGGIHKMLESYLKHNPDVRKKFLKEIGEPSAKKQKVNKFENAGEHKMTTRRKSSVHEEWVPKAEHNTGVPE